MMKEFGSDFHFIDDYFSNRASLQRIYPEAYYYANGRQCIVALIEQYGWKRIWMPQYFCYEVIDSIKATGIEVLYYADSPICDGVNSISKLEFNSNDVLLRVNYFGLREFRDEEKIPIPVIEDHSHDLLGHWALYSNADWCIASLRKSLPVAEGGMVWSPKGLTIDKKPKLTSENSKMAEKRWKAMESKSIYLNQGEISKEEFRTLFINTEEALSTLPLSLLDSSSVSYLEHFDINLWYNRKKKNWNYLKDTLSETLHVLLPEDETCNPFSFIILMDSAEQRELIRKKLIESAIYPAILWHIPHNENTDASGVSEKILSIHCDGRYSEEDMHELSCKLKQILI